MGEGAPVEDVDGDGEALRSEPPAKEQRLAFGTGLLPKESLAEGFRGAFQWRGFEAGFLFVSGKSKRLGASFALGLDFGLHELKSPLFWRACVAEFVGTLLFLYFSIATVVYREEARAGAAEAAGEVGLTSAEQLMIASAFGFMLFLMVLVFAPVSGAHLNPAVSFGLMLTRKVTATRAAVYCGCQLLGAWVGVLLAKSLSPEAFDAAGGGVNANADPALFTTHALLGAEILGTLLLLLVVYAAVDPERAGDTISIAALTPFAIGMAVFVAHLATIPVTGTGINPARSFGTAAVAGDWTDQWVFWVGPLIGAAIAAVMYEVLFKGRREFENKFKAD